MMMRVQLRSFEDQPRTFSQETSPCVSQQKKEVRTSTKQLLWFSFCCLTFQKEPLVAQKKCRRQFSSNSSPHNLRITEFSHDKRKKNRRFRRRVYHIYTVSMTKFPRSVEPTIIKSEGSLQGEACQ